jgi:hypothetical protein
VLTYSAGDSGSATSFAMAGTTPVVINTHRRGCEVTFVLRGGRVEQVNYAGRTGPLFARGAECAYVVENCVP